MLRRRGRRKRHTRRALKAMREPHARGRVWGRSKRAGDGLVAQAAARGAERGRGRGRTMPAYRVKSFGWRSSEACLPVSSRR